MRGILERLSEGEVVIGDGGFLHALERRGYVRAGVYTPECTVENPEAGKYITVTADNYENFDATSVGHGNDCFS